MFPQTKRVNYITKRMHSSIMSRKSFPTETIIHTNIYVSSVMPLMTENFVIFVSQANLVEPSHQSRLLLTPVKIRRIQSFLTLSRPGNSRHIFGTFTVFIHNSQTMYPSKVKITQHSLHTRSFKGKKLSPRELTIVLKKI